MEWFIGQKYPSDCECGCISSQFKSILLQHKLEKLPILHNVCPLMSLQILYKVAIWQDPIEIYVVGVRVRGGFCHRHKLQNIYFLIAKCIFPNCKMYLCWYKNVFVLISKCFYHNFKMNLSDWTWWAECQSQRRCWAIGTNCKIYLSTLQNVFVFIWKYIWLIEIYVVWIVGVRGSLHHRHKWSPSETALGPRPSTFSQKSHI